MEPVKKARGRAKKSHFGFLVFLTALVLLWVLFMGQPFSKSAPSSESESRKNWQGYDKFPEAFYPSLNLLGAFERFRVPSSPRFDYPLGSENGALVYNAQAYWSLNERRGGRHTGDDLNGIGGQNSDLRDPVYAPANGLVVYAGELGPGWGKSLIIAHRTLDGKILQTMFSHLDEMLVTCNRQVARGELIGRVGTANGNYLAHLHFEVREGEGIDIGPGYLNFFTNRRNPLETIMTYRGGGESSLASSPLKLLKQKAVISSFSL